MKLSFDGQEYTVPVEEEILFLQQFQGIMLHEYDKLDPNMRFLAKPVARGFLQKLENEARAKYGKEKALEFRPDKKQDAVVHLSTVMVGIMREVLKNVTLEVGTIDHTVAAFKIGFEGQGPAGGQMVIDGNVRERQNHSPEIP